MNSEAFIREILKKHGENCDILDQTSSLVKIDGLTLLTAYLKKNLPGFQKIKIQPQKTIFGDYYCIAITFCSYPKFYAPETHLLKFIYNDAIVQCSSNNDELLEAVKFAANQSDLGINIDKCSSVFFRDNPNYKESSREFILFKRGMTVEKILTAID